MELCIKNNRVLTFYESHPNIDFETMNILLVNVLEEVFKESNVNPTIMDNNLVTELVNNFKDLQSKVTESSEATKSITLQLYKMQNENMEQNRISAIQMNDFFSARFADYRRESLSDIKTTFGTEMGPLLQEKTERFLKEMETFHDNSVMRDVTKLVGEMQTSILQSVQYGRLDKETLLKTMEEKFSGTFLHSQTLLNAAVTVIQQETNQTRTKVDEFVNRLSNSSSKGKLSENILMTVLESLFPSGDIQSVGTIAATGDIILRRLNSTIPILIETKEYSSRNITKDEVDKFYRDVSVQNMCGLFLSQHGGIANIRDFEIVIRDGCNICVFVHNVNFSPEKIQTAISIIDHFKETLDKFSNSSTGTTNEATSKLVSISKDTLQKVNSEFRIFIDTRTSLVNMVKDFSNKMNRELETLKMPNLGQLLQESCGGNISLTTVSFECETCHETFSSKKALGSHTKRHKSELQMVPTVSTVSMVPTGSIEPTKPKLNK